MGHDADPMLTPRFEVDTLLYPVDVVFTYKSPSSEEKHLAIEIDGSNHYYALERHPTTKTELKYRLFDAVGLNYLRLEYFDYV